MPSIDLEKRRMFKISGQRSQLLRSASGSGNQETHSSNLLYGRDQDEDGCSKEVATLFKNAEKFMWPLPQYAIVHHVLQDDATISLRSASPEQRMGKQGRTKNETR